MYRTVALSRCRSSRKSIRSVPISLPHQFDSSPVGFNPSAVNEWLSTSHVAKDVTSSNASDPLLGYPLVAISPTKWARADQQDRLSMIHLLRFIANKVSSYNLRMLSSDFLKDRN